MFGLFKKDPRQKLIDEIEAKYKRSVQLQRNGKLREYGVIMVEIEALEAQLRKLSN